MSKTNLIPSECRVCGAPASYSYYGAMACESCKMFFKRNADNQKKIFRCDFDGYCEVNVNNRHICSACRLLKCFKVGMCTEMFRSSRVVKRKAEVIIPTSSEVVPWKSRTPLQIRPLNLLNCDSSLLDSDQWALMRNLIHSYDERHAIQVGKEFVQELDRSHPKLRYRMSSKRILEICGLIYKQTEPCIRVNRDFHDLSSHDRSVVLRSAVDNVSCFAGGFTLWNSGLILDSAVCKALENAFGTMAFKLTLLQISLLDQDLYTIKLALSLVAFCVSNCTSYDKDWTTHDLQNPQKILSIESKYSELLWKYLLYKYSFSDAVRRFTQLVQCIIVTLTIRVHLENIRNHTDVVDSLVQKIEQQGMDFKDN